jgi:hypothetical protein
LGFRFSTFREPPVYSIVRRDSVEIHLGKADGSDAAPNAPHREESLDAYVWVDDVDALFEELKSRGAEIVEPPTVCESHCCETGRRRQVSAWRLEWTLQSAAEWRRLHPAIWRNPSSCNWLDGLSQNFTSFYNRLRPFDTFPFQALIFAIVVMGLGSAISGRVDRGSR